MRFSIRTLLMAVLVTAVLVTVLLHQQWQSRWGGVSAGLVEWEKQVNRADHQVDQYRWVTYQNSGGAIQQSDFIVLTAEPTEVFVSTQGEWDWSMGDGPVSEDPRRFYVLPPGRWVESVDDIISTWERFEKKSRAPLKP